MFQFECRKLNLAKNKKFKGRQYVKSNRQYPQHATYHHHHHHMSFSSQEELDMNLFIFIHTEKRHLFGRLSAQRLEFSENKNPHTFSAWKKVKGAGFSHYISII